MSRVLARRILGLNNLSSVVAVRVAYRAYSQAVEIAASKDDEPKAGDIEIDLRRSLGSHHDVIAQTQAGCVGTTVSKISVANRTNESVYQTPADGPWTVLTHKWPEKGWKAYNPRNMRKPALTADIKHVKMMSWNVNGLKRLLESDKNSVMQLAQREDFDILCLQETQLQKNDVEAIKSSLLEGYEHSFWTCSVSKLDYSGTAIISRIKPLSVRYGLGIAEHDDEGRLITLEFDTFYLIGGYIPNSSTGLKRLAYRVEQWDPALSNYMKELEKLKPVILTGDLNCAHKDIDIHNPGSNKRKAGFTIEERRSFEKNFLDKGFVDTFRRQHRGVLGYTFWGWDNGRETNKGWRLDYFLVSKSIMDNVYDSYILPDVASSDHSPIGLVLTL
ncbi:hypothetical protein AgCh_003741 [Apium graveolens]